MVVGVTDAAGLGALRHIDAAKRAAAMALVREGRMFDLGRELHEGIPVFPGRHFRQTLVPNPGPALGGNQVDWSHEVVSTTMQLGTHLDALCHLRMGDVGYDGFTLAESHARRRHAPGHRDRPADRHPRVADRRGRPRTG